MCPYPLRERSILKRRVHDSFGHFGVVQYRKSKDSRLPLKFFYSAFSQLLFIKLLQLIESGHQLQPNLRFQQFQPIHFHGQVVQPHFVVCLFGKILFLHILLGLPRKFLHIQLGRPFLCLRYGYAFFAGIFGVKTVDLLLDLTHRISVNILDFFVILSLGLQVLLQILPFPLYPVVFTAHRHCIHR